MLSREEFYGALAQGKIIQLQHKEDNPNEWSTVDNPSAVSAYESLPMMYQFRVLEPTIWHYFGVGFDCGQSLVIKYAPGRVPQLGQPMDTIEPLLCAGRFRLGSMSGKLAAVEII